LYRRAAVFVDKSLKGTKPADLPVEQPKKFDFIINKSAKQINLTIPRNVLAGRDQNNDAVGHQSNLWGSYVDIDLFLSSRVHFAPDNFHDCSLLDRTSLTNHDMHLKREKGKDVFLWKSNTKGILSKSRPNIIMVIFHGNQFAE